MGRYSWSNRETVEDCKSLDICWLNRKGYLSGFWTGSIEWKNAMGEVTGSIGIQVSVDRGGCGEDHVRVFYSQVDGVTGEKKKDLDYKIHLVSTPCHFGGKRFWFLCPLVANGIPCGRRVGKLYLAGGQTYFGCRHCYNLTYRSCKEHYSRVSAVMKLPPGELSKLLESKDPKSSLLGLKAWFKMLDKFR
jgi:hypothetical protein